MPYQLQMLRALMEAHPDRVGRLRVHVEALEANIESQPAFCLQNVRTLFEAAHATTAPQLGIQFAQGGFPDRMCAVIGALDFTIADHPDGAKINAALAALLKGIDDGRKLSDRLDETLRRYHNRAVDSVQVIEELIALAKDISAETASGAELGLNNEELAFYDALAENGSARELMAHEQLQLLAQMLVHAIHNSATIDWTKKESVRAKMRIEVRKLLARHGYPPDLQRAAVDLVIRQAKTLAGAALA
jgi:hypothetical protein